MATATPARRTRAKAKPAGTSVTPEDFISITRWLDTEVLVERAMELRMLTLGLLSGTNVHLIGPPGTAKSLALRQYVRCITGASYFEKTVHAQLPADAIIGGYDMEGFAQGHGLVRKVEGYMPAAHVAFLDELPRANGPTLDATLPMMNTEERMAEHNGGMMVTPLLFVVTASNTWFDPDNTQAQALSDRVTLMCQVARVRSDESFMDMLRRHHVRNVARFTDVAPTYAAARPVLTLEQVKQAQSEVAQVRLGAEFLLALAKLRREATGQGLNVSDRRWTELPRVCRAAAWLSGRDECLPDDLVVCEHGMWREQQDIATAAKLVQEYHGRFVREAREKRAEAEPALARVEQIRPQVEGTPPTGDLDPAVIKEAINASRAIDECKTRVEQVIAEAEREKREAPELRDLDNELLAVQKWFHANNLPTQYSRK